MRNDLNDRNHLNQLLELIRSLNRLGHQLIQLVLLYYSMALSDADPRSNYFDRFISNS